MRLLRAALLTIGGLGACLFLAYHGFAAYLGVREQQEPSARRVLQLADGQQIVLIQPTASAAGQPTAEAQASGPRPPAPTQPARPALLPPEQISLPALGVSWPVVLGDNENLPQFKGVGWLLGSGFPGQPGNMVLFGHLGGPHATFDQLHLLAPGDEFSVATAEGSYRYRIRERFETSPSDVAVLAPSASPTATLITCSGPWDAAAQTNERRLIVVADLVS
jgi:sortase A